MLQVPIFTFSVYFPNICIGNLQLIWCWYLWNFQHNVYVLSIELCNLQDIFVDSLCMYQILRIYHRGHCVSKITLSHQTEYLLYSKQTVLFMDNISSTTTRDNQELFTLKITKVLFGVTSVRWRCMVSIFYKYTNH